MKIAVSGKGGVGKTTLAALLVRIFNEAGMRVLAIDADPDANLAAAVGVPGAGDIIPIAEMNDLIHERTESPPGAAGGFFKLNPRVDDLPETLSARLDRIKLLRLGGVKKGGGGCICPESALLRALMTHVVLIRDEVAVLDMEAGIEHLGRATAAGVDCLIVVVEPGRRSVETAHQVRRLARDIGIRRIAAAGNKIRRREDQDFLAGHLGDLPVLGWIPYDEALIESDLGGRSPFENESPAVTAARKIAEVLKTDALKKKTGGRPALSSPDQP